MSDATHFNEISGMYYLFKNGNTYFWHDLRWRLSAFKENDLTLDNGFMEL